MRWFFIEHRPRLRRIVAFLLIGYVAYLVIPVVLSAGSSPFNRVFASVAA